MNKEKRNKRAKEKQKQNNRERYQNLKSLPAQARSLGNRDSGCPYKGPDKYSGMFKKFSDRFEPNENKPGGFCHCYNNNKYSEDATL